MKISQKNIMDFARFSAEVLVGIGEILYINPFPNRIH